MTRAEADRVLAKLKAIRDGAEADMRSHWYAIGSGQPDADIGALNMAYKTTVTALQNEEEGVVSGYYDEARWLQLVDVAETSMRAIQGYTGESSASAEVDFIASKEAETITGAVSDVTHVAGVGVWAIIKGAFKGAPVLMTLALLVVIFLVFGPFISLFASARKSA